MLSANKPCCHPNTLLFRMSPWWYFNSSRRMEARCRPHTDQECHRRDAVEAWGPL
ncbi:unnamed protein product, partial [Caretta caretta]